MNRELTKEELNLTTRAIEKMKKETVDAKESISLTKKQIEYIKVKREYEDMIKPYNRKQQDTEHEKALKMANQAIESNKINTKELEKQIKEGVEIKKMNGVD